MYFGTNEIFGVLLSTEDSESENAIIDVENLPPADKRKPNALYRPRKDSVEGGTEISADSLYWYDESTESWKKIVTLEDLSYEKLPDKPFGTIKGIDKLVIDRTKGSVALKSGTAYFQTEKTYTVDQLIGATGDYNNDSNRNTYTVTQSMIVDETADGVTIKVWQAYIFVAYTTNYTPSQASTPFPNVGVYFSEDSNSEYYVIFLTKEDSIKYLDYKFLKQYKHSLVIEVYDTANIRYGTIYTGFISFSPIGIGSLQGLKNSPACQYENEVSVLSGRLMVNDMSGEFHDIRSLTVYDDKLTLKTISYYGVPASTNLYDFNSEYVTILDSVTEV